jgi:hypothetical protein
MADRYWVGGSGSWNSTAKWSTTSGGSGGASVPTSADNVIFDTNSGSGTAHYTVTVTDNSTCANLTFSPETAVGVTQFVVSNGFVITGTFSTSSTEGNRRLWIQSSTYGLMRDMRIAAIGSVSDVDFRDIRVTGAGGTLSGTRIGDLRGNSGITFSTPKTVYWNLGGTSASTSDNAWAASSGAGVSTDNFPLAQDTAVFNNSSTVPSGNIITSSAIPYIGAVDMGNRTSAIRFQTAANPFSVYGNFTCGSGTVISDSGNLTFSNRNTQTITSAGKTFSGGVTVDSYGGTVELADALNIGGQTLIVTNGTFDTKNYNVTAGNFTSNNSNVRTINLGSSTVTLSGEVTFTTSTNLTFNSGTSSITFSSSATTVNGGAQTFYDVSFSSTSGSTHTINQSNTFNSLSITAPASAGLRQVSFAANQTINGTLTVAGATAVRRIFVRSDTIGTTRTLTVNSLSATDCDFRDITIAGAAAGSTPTRAGDCGGNAGITFPAAKTVYWNLAGAQNWSATAWAPGSGGSPDINNFPLAQDTAVFDNAGATSTVTFDNSWNIGTFDASARTTAMTIATTSTVPVVHGNWLFGAGVISSGTTAIAFGGRGTQIITSNGVVFTQGININNVTGTTQLADALTLNSSQLLILTSGTFDAVSYNVTVGLFSDNSSALRTLKMGSGTWTLSGIGSIWTINGTTNFNFYKGAANIVLSSTSDNPRTFTGAGLSYNKLTIGGTTTTSTTTISGNNQFTELASTKTVAHTIALATTTQTFGAWTVSGTAGNVVTLTGTGTSHVLAGACTSGIDYLAMGSIGFAATSPGEFYAGANSTGTAAAPVYRTAKPADSTRYWVGGTGNWSDTARWSTSSGGGSGASVPRSHDDVVFDALSNATAYTATVNAVTGGIRTKALTIAGPLLGNLTLAGSTAIDGIHGNVTLPATGLTRTYTGAITLSGSSTGRTLTTNGVALASAITVNGVGCGWTLGSALDMGSSVLTVTNGLFDCDTYNLTAGRLTCDSSNSRTVDFGSGTVTFSSSPISFGETETSRAALTVTAGTAQINCSTTSSTFSGNNQTFYNVAFTSTSAGTVTLNSANTFNNLSFTGLTSAGLKNVSITANQTVNGTLTLSAGTNATMRTFVRSNTIGTTRTLTCAAVSATDADFRDITIAGAAAPASGTRLGDCKGNSGITFDAAKTVYWRVSSGGNWGSTGDVWSLTPSGASDANNTPLAQDTAVFTSTLPSSGATVTINAAYNIGTIDMSARTTNTMTLATGSITPFIYGNWINGTGTTLTGTGQMTFAGRGSQTITSAGKTFTQDFTIDTPSGSVALQDAFITTRSLRLTSGTFNAISYNVTLGLGFNSANSNIRTIAIGSGTFTSSGTSSDAWNLSASTNFTFTGTGVINLTSASAKTFISATNAGVSYSGITLNQGGAGTLTITGDNTFANITNTYKATGATTIALGTTTQRVGAFGASGEAGRVLTVTGTSATSPATLVFTGSGQATTPTTDYLTITGVRAYSLDTTWYAGNNSTNNGSLGWYFVAGGGGAVTAFIIESSIAADSISGFAAFNTNASETTTAADSISSLASFGVGISETITASEAQASGLICLGTLSETATATDVAAAFQAYVAAVSEATTATDLIAASRALDAAISELSTVSDQDSAASSLSTSVSELVTIAESLSGGLLFLSDISETITVQELISAGLIFNQSINEATTAEEVVSAIAVLNTTVTDSASVTDSISPAGSEYNSSLDDSVVMSDSNQGANNLTLSVSESITSSDSYSCNFTAASYIIERSVMMFGPISVTTIQFDYEAVKDLYNRKRTVYVPRSSVSSERVVVVPVMNRLVYVPRESVSAERKGLVSVVDRAVYVSGRSTSDDRTTSVDE